MTHAFADNYRLLAKYNSWMNGRLYGACEQLTDEARNLERGAFFGSIHRTLNHLVVTDQVWLRRLSRSAAEQGMASAALAESLFEIPEVYQLDAIPYPDWNNLKAKRAQLDAAMEAWTASIEERFLNGAMHYSNSKGVVRNHPAWQGVTHLFNHQTHHRSQVITLLTQAGVDVGVTDLLALL